MIFVQSDFPAHSLQEQKALRLSVENKPYYLPEINSKEEFLYESPSQYAHHKKTENRKIEIQSPHVPT